MGRLHVLLALLRVAGAAIATAQKTAPTFDAVSIKLSPNPPTARAIVIPVRAGRWHQPYVTLDTLTAYAYGLHCCNTAIEGGPPWVKTQGFSIEAPVSPATVSPDDFRAMIRQMLTDRFHLVSHAATDTVPVYTLDVAPGGAKLKPAAAPCEPSDAPVVISANMPLRCGLNSRPTEAPDKFFLYGRSITMPELAELFEQGLEPQDTERHAVVGIP